MKKIFGITAIVPLMALVMSMSGCPKGAQGLAAASDTIAHALADTQQAVAIACTANQIDAPTCMRIEADLAKTAQAGKTLDAAIRANQSVTGLAPTVNAFLDAFNQLQNQDVLAIKNPNTKIAISTLLTGAESAFSVIAATAGK